jgi:pyrroloquinoline quinone biosynthesis protein D
MHAIDQEMRPCQATAVVAQQAAGKWVLLDVKTGHYFALDGVAGRIWQLCDGTRSVLQITEVLCEEYDAQDHEVRDDVTTFVSELVRESLLV